MKITDNENSHLQISHHELVNMWQQTLISALYSVLSSMTITLYVEFWLLLEGKKSLSGYQLPKILMGRGPV